MIYIADRRWYRQRGWTYTQAHYFLGEYGPLCDEFVLAIEWMRGVEIDEKVLRRGSAIRYDYGMGHFDRFNEDRIARGFGQLLTNAYLAYSQLPTRELLDKVFSLREIEAADFGDELLGG